MHRYIRGVLVRIGRKFNTLSVHLCLQHVFRDAARRAGSSATADACIYSFTYLSIMLYTD